MIVMRAVGWRLDKVRAPHLNELMSTEDSMTSAEQLFREKGQSMIKTRLANSIVIVRAADGELVF